MTSTPEVPLGEARDRLSELVVEVSRTHHRITITRHGHPDAVLISPDDLAALEETVDILSHPEVADALREGIEDAGAGRFADTDAIKAKYLR
ncbi:type II toxin-antitoxin system Phd/YefM family antitoxin [Amycolatopsis alkalitolerans]|uniref:Antitoxin n=1 Tax=Amycolatopsis alkalitolerans TaxID=2547244 RepID=A0A5C4M236_9PSEU|nr:type II toxin-antitoxin system Phd/YefM family antitoxin [Amycolatopsis alkalitolerans]TNC26122.1 type II toxin-antitoxin system Phd/YefM family antitoxin [Amycolatopsis alkalitolerans]